MRILKALALFLCLAIPAAAANLRVAAAADLSFAMKEIAARFETLTGNKVALSFGSSGNFYAEIGNGAPFDVFCSADTGYPQKLVVSGLAFSDSFYSYARGSIVLWAPNNSKLDLKRGLAVLLDPTVHKIAIANPQHAPYGRAAEAALRSQHLWEKIQDKLVLGENISQTAQFVSSGNADVGILALSLATSPGLKDQGYYELIPADDYPAINQAAVVLKSSKHEKAARAFVEFLKKPEIKDLLHQYGFEAASDKSQGTTLVVPHDTQKTVGFSPCARNCSIRSDSSGRYFESAPILQTVAKAERSKNSFTARLKSYPDTCLPSADESSATTVPQATASLLS